MANAQQLFTAGFAQSAQRQQQTQQQKDAIAAAFWDKHGNPDISLMGTDQKMTLGFKLQDYRQQMQQHADRIRRAPLPLSALGALGLSDAEREIVQELAGMAPVV